MQQKNFLIFLSIFFSVSGLNAGAAEDYRLPITDSVPSALTGDFIDDYNISYTIRDTIWLQHPDIRYHIIRWNTDQQYLLAKNDPSNPSEPGLYTRIDYLLLNNMVPYSWGFCLTVYNAESEAIAEKAAQADRINPKKGCNGFPFSRLKRMDKQAQ